ncbi:hypothetical protein Dimus_036458 [Dionaea muscipula]
MKRFSSGKGVDAEPESKKNSAPGTTKEIDIPHTEVPRPDLVLTSGKRNLVPTKEKHSFDSESCAFVDILHDPIHEISHKHLSRDMEEEEVLNEANSVEEDSTLTSKEENCRD